MSESDPSMIEYRYGGKLEQRARVSREKMRLTYSEQCMETAHGVVTGPLPQTQLRGRGLMEAIASSVAAQVAAAGGK